MLLSYRPTKATVFSDHFMYKLASTSHFDRREMEDLFSGRDELLAGKNFSGLSPFVKRPDDRSRAYVCTGLLFGGCPC